MARITADGNRWVVSGDMTMQQVNALLAESGGLSMPARLEVDLGKVAAVDTTTISVMFEWLRRAQAQQCELKYTNFPQNLISLATLYGVLDIIPQVTH